MHFYDFQPVGEKLKGIPLDASDAMCLVKVSVEFSQLEKKLMKFKMEFYIFSRSLYPWTRFAAIFISSDRANQFSKHIFRWNYLSSFWNN